MSVSFVSSFYNNSDDVDKFYDELMNQINSLDLEYEIILIDDGSQDDTSRVLRKIVEKNPKVSAFQNITNYGEQKSYTFGLKKASLDYVFIVESDLDINLKNIPLFLEEIQKNNEVDMIYATVKKSLLQKLSISNLFFTIFNKISNLKLPQNAAWFRVIRSELVGDIQDFNEYEFHLAGTLSLLSKKELSIEVIKSKSKSKYSFFNKYLLAINTFINFTSRPLEVVLGIGFSFVLLNALFLIYLVFFRINYNPTPGWVSIMFSIFATFTILLIILGVLSLYISKIYKEVRQIPKIISKKL